MITNRQLAYEGVSSIHIARWKTQGWDRQMGTISDELDVKNAAAYAMLHSATILPVPSLGFMAAGTGPVVGVAYVQVQELNDKLAEIAKALKHVSAAVKKVEEKIKLLETVNPATGRPLPPPGFRR